MFTKISTAILLVALIAPVSEANNLTSTKKVNNKAVLDNVVLDEVVLDEALLKKASKDKSTFSTNKTAEQIAKLCFSSKWDKEALLLIAERGFAIENDSERNNLAKQLVNCLAVPDPKVRDDVAYFGLSKWLRAKELSVDSKHVIFTELIENFGKPIPDEHDVYQAFVALVLSEFARADRKSPYLSDKQRELLVAKSTEYMVNITDYRGFDEVVGWRHKVAHTADIFLQLALNPALKKEQLTRLLNAIGEKIIPHDVHFYTYGEAERLAKPLIYIFLQGQHNSDDWQNWLKRYITPVPFDDWQQVFSSQQGLARLHNARAFLTTIFVFIADSKNEQLIMLKPALINALDSLP
ncbi:MAG: hypothetical protein ACI9O6_002655 [Glaciecola sp.]|jgi:hypothetical protein